MIVEKIEHSVQKEFTKARQIQFDFTVYQTTTKEQIKHILKNAGVLDKVHALELDMMEKQKIAEDRLSQIQQKLDKLNSLKVFAEEYEAELVVETPSVIDANALLNPVKGIKSKTPLKTVSR